MTTALTAPRPSNVDRYRNAVRIHTTRVAKSLDHDNADAHLNNITAAVRGTLPKGTDPDVAVDCSVCRVNAAPPNRCRRTNTAGVREEVGPLCETDRTVTDDGVRFTRIPLR